MLKTNTIMSIAAVSVAILLMLVATPIMSIFSFYTAFMVWMILAFLMAYFMDTTGFPEYRDFAARTLVLPVPVAVLLTICLTAYMQIMDANGLL